MIVGKHTYGHNLIKYIKSSESPYDLYIGNFCSIAEGLTVYIGGIIGKIGSQHSLLAKPIETYLLTVKI